MRVIFGSGIVGLIAKYLLAGDWEVVPFSRSRFYSYMPPLADNVIIRDPEIDEAVAALGGKLSPHLYRYAYSVNGHLVFEFNRELAYSWLQKFFLGDVPSQALAYWSNRLVVSIYDLRVTALYAKLLAKYLLVLKAEAAKGEVTAIGDHHFMRGGERVDFTEAVSTIPLPILHGKMGKDSSGLKTADEFYYCVESNKLDFEGANQVLVADNVIEFYRCINISPHRYVFYSTRDIVQPGAYLLNFVGAGNLIDGTSIKGAIPLGEMANLSEVEKAGIFCVGANAQHDWCMDLSSCIKRLVRYAARNYKPSLPCGLKEWRDES